LKIPAALKPGLITLIATSTLFLSNIANAAPVVPKWAWADAGAGLASSELGPFSILVAVAASMALGVDPPPKNSGVGINAGNPANKFDQYGALHNQIVLDYYKQYRRFELSDYYGFLKTNGAKYGFTTLPPKSTLSKAITEYGEPSLSIGTLLGRIDTQLKTDGVEDDFVDQIEKLSPNQTLQAQIDSIIEIENSALESTTINPVQLQQLSILFSILRYSDALWTPPPGECPVPQQ
jgi:hypothetical protein